jgi:hypothetical protein
MKLNPNQDLSLLSDDELVTMAGYAVQLQEADRREFALHYYKPANDTVARIHDLTCGTIGIFGGNGSGKTEHALVEGIIRCTGQIPEALKSTYPREKLRGPIHMRVVCESLTTVLEPIILPKLQWMTWSGLPPPGGDQGHWGWIPRHCLIQGDWKKSYNSRLRILTVLYRNPDTDVVEGTSSLQFMSYDQNSTDFASGDVNYCLHDEPPTYPIWKENRARCMRGGKGSTMLVSMTWPDNPATPVDWIFDEIFDKGTPGPLKDKDVEIINIFSTMNPHLDAEEIVKRASQMTATERNTRIYGLPIRFSNRIHPDFTDQPRLWCFECGKMVLGDLTGCADCHGKYVSFYNNVESCNPVPRSPCYCLLDPHPRKPHMLLWVQVTTNDDYEVLHEELVEGGAEAVRDTVHDVEAGLGHYTYTRLMDPNMGASPSGATRELTWQTEFDNVGLRFDLADDSDVGRARLNDMIKPDAGTMRTRLTIDPTCATTIFQLKRYVWADHLRPDQHDLKQVPVTKNDDFPTLLKYLMNRLPSHTDTVTDTVYRRTRYQEGLYARR